MKKILYSIFTLIFCSTAFAQNNSVCPNIKFISPTSAIRSGETMKFSIFLSDEKEDLKPIYKWTVSLGTIIEGQGTKDLKVSTVGLESIVITATVEIDGLPENCQNKFSESIAVTHVIGDIFYEEYEKISFLKERHIIDQNMTVSINNPDFYEIFYLNFKNPTQKQINSKISRIQKHFNHRAYSFDKVVFVIRQSDHDYTRITFEKSDADENFRCDGCKILKILRGKEINRKNPYKITEGKKQFSSV